jgi:membrane protease subunit HflK
MGWNEPPGGNKDKDPWGKGPPGGDDGPPDLDEIVKKMQDGLGGIFGRRPSGVRRSGNGGSSFTMLGIVIALLAGFFYNITYTINQQERGVVMRFGNYVKTMQPGLNFALPSFIDKVERINVGQVRSIRHSASMLTQDENIVDVEVAVQWRIDDPTDYLFNVTNPDETLVQVAESAVRSVIGKSTLDYVLTEGRSDVAQRQELLMQQILADYQAGILIVRVDMQIAKPPEPVKAAFDDAIKAREDEQRLVNEAEAYRNEILPQARGQAARIREQSNGYKARVIAESEGNASRFEQLLTEYQRAPVVTRERMYLETMQQVLSNTNKILIDSPEDGSNSLIYLPLDRLMENNAARARSGQQSIRGAENNSSTGQLSQDLYNRADRRDRGAR